MVYITEQAHPPLQQRQRGKRLTGTTITHNIFFYLHGHPAGVFFSVIGTGLKQATHPGLHQRGGGWDIVWMGESRAERSCARLGVMGGVYVMGFTLFFFPVIMAVPRDVVVLGWAEGVMRWSE